MSESVLMKGMTPENVERPRKELKKNCNNCEHLEWADGDIGDESGFCCNKRDYFSHGSDWQSHERKHLNQLDTEAYREKAKRCCDLKM